MNKRPAIDVIGHEKCTGCFVCQNACPNDAIEIYENEEGFYYPKVNEKCKRCGICQDFCPVLNPVASAGEPKFYAGWSNDDRIRLKASSGGVFPELAKYVLENGGVVFCVKWDEKLNARHVKVERIEDLEKAMGSKYVQSYVGLAYREALREAKNRPVLFSGTPCQTAALRSFIGSENVITVDVVCHGVPSNLIFRKYLEFLEQKAGKRVVEIWFRDKKKGWENFHIVFKLEDGAEIRLHHYLDPFFRGYLLNFYLRPSCYSCPFCQIPRFSDITLGDFWGAPKNLRDRRGLSVVIANSERGRKILDELFSLGRIELVEVSKELATRGNPRIIEGKYGVPKERDLILKKLKEADFEEIFENLKPNPILFWVKKFVSSVYKKFR